MSVISHNCPSCGDILNYNIESHNWTCNSCDCEYTIDELRDSLAKKEFKRYGYVCENCGADIIALDDSVSTVCVYCNSPVIIREKMKGNNKPDYIVPFEHKKEDIIALFLSQKNKRGLCPNDYFSFKNIESVSGVYVPYWLYNCDADFSCEGETLDHKGDKVEIVRHATCKFERIPADAKTKLDNRYLNGIEPFDYKNIKPFEFSYLAGFNAERYDEEFDDAFDEQIKERIYESTLAKVSNMDKYSFIYTNLEKTIFVRNVKVEYVLMPVWCIKIRYHGEIYTYYVNDQNMIISGTYPMSVPKEMTFWLLIFIYTGLFGVLALYVFPIDLILLFGIILVGVWGWMLDTEDDYKKVRKRVSKVQYVKPRSFKFTEYKNK